MRYKKILLLLISAVLLSAVIPAYTSNGQVDDDEMFIGPLHGGRAYIKIVDSDAAFTALETGEIDVLGLQRPDQIEDAEALGFTIEKTIGMGLQNGYYFNFQRDIVNDIEFRKAVVHLYPKEELFADLYGPLREYAVSFIGPAYGKWHNPDIEDFAEYDPELAAYILDQAGYTLNPQTGIRIDPATGQDIRDIEIAYPTEWPEGVTITERIADEMEAIGVPVTLVPAPFGTGEWVETSC